MRIGCPKEIKNHEYRVGLTPESARELARHGHEVWIESGAGLGIDATDEQYMAAGAKIVDGPDPIFAECEMVVKVKEPQAVERKKLREGQILYTYLHLAPDPVQAKGLIKSGCTAIAYETVTEPSGGLPLLRPMSQVAGRMSMQVAAWALMRTRRGRGLLLGGVPGTQPAKVIIIGGGVSGTNAAEIAVGMRADVTVFDRNNNRLAELDAAFTLAGDKLIMLAIESEEECVMSDDVWDRNNVAGTENNKEQTSLQVQQPPHDLYFVCH